MKIGGNTSDTRPFDEGRVFFTNKSAHEVGRVSFVSVLVIVNFYEGVMTMQHKGTVTLETDRLILRRFKIEDADIMYRNWASDDEVTKFLTWPTHSSPELTKTLLSYWIKDYEKSDIYNWAIEIKDTQELIGNISVVSIVENTSSAVLGYGMGTKWWGQGFMPEAGKAVIKYLFEEVGFNRIAANHDKNNPKSGRVMQKIGMQYEGTLRSAGFCNQGVIDDVWYSILKDEYKGE